MGFNLVALPQGNWRQVFFVDWEQFQMFFFNANFAFIWNIVGVPVCLLHILWNILLFLRFYYLFKCCEVFRVAIFVWGEGHAFSSCLNKRLCVIFRQLFPLKGWQLFWQLNIASPSFCTNLRDHCKWTLWWKKTVKMLIWSRIIFLYSVFMPETALCCYRVWEIKLKYLCRLRGGK